MKFMVVCNQEANLDEFSKSTMSFKMESWWGGGRGRGCHVKRDLCSTCMPEEGGKVLLPVEETMGPCET